MRYPIYALVLTLAGCVTAEQVALPNGTKGYTIDCSGGEFTVSDCMNKAAEVCAGPYQILTGGTESAGGVMMPVGTGMMYVPATTRTMIVSCGAH